jgi:hypothetical protein
MLSIQTHLLQKGDLVAIPCVLLMLASGEPLAAVDARLAQLDRFSAIVSVAYFHAPAGEDFTEPGHRGAVHDFEFPYFVQVARPALLAHAQLDRPERGYVPVIESVTPSGYVREHVRREPTDEGYWTVAPRMDSGSFRQTGLLSALDYQFQDFQENGLHLRSLFERGLAQLVGESAGVRTYRAEAPNGTTDVVCEFDLDADATPLRIKHTFSAAGILPFTRELRVTQFQTVRGARLPAEAYVATSNPNVSDLVTVVRVCISDVCIDDSLTPEAVCLTPVPVSSRIVTARSDGFNESVTYDAEGNVTQVVVAGGATPLPGKGHASAGRAGDGLFLAFCGGLVACAAALCLVPLRRGPTAPRGPMAPRGPTAPRRSRS